MDTTDEENIEWLMESSKTVENSGESVDFEKERNELCHFLQVLRSSFENEPNISDMKAKGTISSEEDLQKLLKRLKALGYFFSIRSSDKKSDRRNCKLMVTNNKSNSTSHPYRVISHIHYSCTHRNKEKRKSNEVLHPKQLRKYINCKAVMDIRQVEIFTYICLAPVRRKRIEMLKKFRRNLSLNAIQPGVLKYKVIISLPKVHNHSRNVKGQYLSDEVKAAMHSILRSGLTSLPDIQAKIYQIVDQDFRDDSVKPSRENSAFYPSQKTIYNHLRHDGLALRKSCKRAGTDVAELKRSIVDDLRRLFDDVKECTDFESLERYQKWLNSCLHV